MSTRRTPFLSTLAAATLAGLFTQGIATAQTATQAPSTTAPSASAAGQAVSRTDRQFVEMATSGGKAEVMLGELAQKQASHDQVKQFGSRMVQDHGKANEELGKLASTKGIVLPTTMGREHQAHADQLAKLSGAEFDRAYMKHMVDDHKKDIAAFEKQAKSGSDAELKAFAARTLPTLREHLKLAQSTNDSLKKVKT